MTRGDSLLQAALNGDREHPATPRTPEELAAEARAAVNADARSFMGRTVRPQQAPDPWGLR